MKIFKYTIQISITPSPHLRDVESTYLSQRSDFVQRLSQVAEIL